VHSVHRSQLARTTPLDNLASQLHSVVYASSHSLFLLFFFCAPFPSCQYLLFNFALGRAPNKNEDLFDYSSDLAWQAANPTNFTSSDGTFPTNTSLYNTALMLCSPLNGTSSPSSQCAPYVSATASFYQACLFDVVLGDPILAGSNIDAYADICAKNTASEGVTIGTIASTRFHLHFSYLYTVLPTSGIRCTATGPGLSTPIVASSTPVTFDITARDVSGNIVTTGGDIFVVTISGIPYILYIWRVWFMTVVCRRSSGHTKLPR
jgi:hypothetical protein